jgi:carboxylesterase type B
MKLPWLQLFSLIYLSAAEPIVTSSETNVTYQGLTRNGLEVFLGIAYGQNTGGENRFKPPQLHIPENASIVDATAYGPACPQPLGRPGLYPLYLSNITDISEDCLNLNVVRPNATDKLSKHPVMVWIHGGSFWSGSNADIAAAPDGLVLQSVANDLPIIHVALNYRLGGMADPTLSIINTD